jgi:PHD/YefM family antitoxin component YafN of YafNO toxin-antitoxin module
MSLQLQYITDQKGKKNAVLVPLSEWRKIQENLEEFERLKDKKHFFEGLAAALSEVKQITEGKKKPVSFEALINEL